MTLGSHHKNRDKKERPKSVDDFIEGANVITQSKEAVKKISPDNILLSDILPFLSVTCLI